MGCWWARYVLFGVVRELVVLQPVIPPQLGAVDLPRQDHQKTKRCLRRAFGGQNGPRPLLKSFGGVS